MSKSFEKLYKNGLTNGFININIKSNTNNEYERNLFYVKKQYIIKFYEYDYFIANKISIFQTNFENDNIGVKKYYDKVSDNDIWIKDLYYKLYNTIISEFDFDIIKN